MSSLLAKLVVAAVFVAAAAACDTRPPQCPKTPKATALKVGHCLPQRQRAVDLTHVLQDGMPIRPGGVPFQKERLTDYDQGHRSHKLELGEDVGTHVDAPAHYVEGKRTIDQLPVAELVVPAVVIDVRAKVKDQPDYRICANDVIDWEAIHGPVPVGSLVIVNTGWHARFIDPAQYVNQDAEGVKHFPGYGADAAALLVERDVMGVAIDTLSLDGGVETDAPTHRIMLAANKIQIENLANLDELPEVGATVILGVLPVANGTQAPARIIALVPEREAGEDDESPADDTAP